MALEEIPSSKNNQAAKTSSSSQNLLLQLWFNNNLSEQVKAAKECDLQQQQHNHNNHTKPLNSTQWQPLLNRNYAISPPLFACNTHFPHKRILQERNPLNSKNSSTRCSNKKHARSNYNKISNNNKVLIILHSHSLVFQTRNSKKNVSHQHKWTQSILRNSFLDLEQQQPLHFFQCNNNNNRVCNINNTTAFHHQQHSNKRIKLACTT